MTKPKKAIVVMLLILFLVSLLSSVQIFPNKNISEIDKLIFPHEIELQEPINLEPDLEPFEPISGSRAGRYLEDYINLNDAAVQLTVMSEDESDNAYNIGGGEPIATGDIDNDGIDDLIMSCPYADGFDDSIASAGQVMVVYGRSQTHPYTIFDQAKKDFDEINLYIHGAGSWDLFGISIACGDIDGDEFDDLVIGALYGDGKDNQRANSGEVYVIYGGARSKLGMEIDLHSTAPDLIIYGEKAWDYCGYSVAIGNVVGDARDDIIIGAVNGDPPGRNNAGRVYIVEGDTRAALGTEIDLLTQADIKLNGSITSDYTGFKVIAEDLNDDNRDDIIIGAPYADISSRVNNGVTYVVFGKQSLGSEIDLRNEADMKLIGAGTADYSGYSLAVGNVNGDNYNDLIIGAPAADGPNNGQTQSGEVYVVYGLPAPTATIDFYSSEQDIVIYGEDAFNWFGYSIASGNVDNDTYDDILIGAPYADGQNDANLNCGDNYLILGNSSSSLGSNIDPRTESEAIFYGVDSTDSAGRYVQLGDIDGDSHDDILIAALFADGPNNARDAVGEFYVVYGAPPPVKNEYFGIIDGDIDNKTILARYRPYTFRINSSNILGYNDFKSITLTFDPLGYNIVYRWKKLKNEFVRIHDPLGLLECVSAGSNVHHDSNYNYSIDFKFIFNWNFTKNYPIDCIVSTVGEKATLDEDIYKDVFWVKNKLNFKGKLKVAGEVQGVLSNNSWVRGGEVLTFSGLTAVYDGTTDYYPLVTEYAVGIEDNSNITMLQDLSAGEEILIEVNAPKLTVDYNYKFRFTKVPKSSDNSSLGLTLKVDAEPPNPPDFITCKADSFDEVEAATMDNDKKIFIEWDAVMEKDSGTVKYYYGFEDKSGTNDSFYTSEVQAVLFNASEGINNIYVWAEDAVGNIGLASSTQILIDLTKLIFTNFTPASDDWLTSTTVACSIEVLDLGGSGVDVETIEYWNMYKGEWNSVMAEISGNPEKVIVDLNIELQDGSKNLIKFRASDLAENGPTESEEFNLKIDSKPVRFRDVKPATTEKLASTEVKCYINVDDLNGSGVDFSSIQYSYSLAGIDNYTKWSDDNLAMIANKSSLSTSATLFVELSFRRGAENYIRWRAKDLAGNGFTYSDNYAVKINSLPIIRVKEVDPNKAYSDKNIPFTAAETYDYDDEPESLQFTWSSNISGKLGTGKNLSARLPAGKHMITVTVYDGYNNATHSFELSVQKPKGSKKGTSSFGFGSDVDLIIIGFILLIIIILIISIYVTSRERKKRKQLEERVILERPVGAEISYIPGVGAQPMVPGASDTQAIEGMSGDDAKQLPSTTTTATATAAQKPEERELQQLPKVGATAAPATTVPSVEGSVGTTPTTTTAADTRASKEPVPQLPPAQQMPTQNTTTTTEPTQSSTPAQAPTTITRPRTEQQTQIQSKPQQQQTTTQAVHLPPTESAEELDEGLGFTPDHPEIAKKMKDEKSQ